MDLPIGYAFGFIGAALLAASCLMKNMLPRMVALSATPASAVHALSGPNGLLWPTLARCLTLTPINIKKVLEIRKLVRAIDNARTDSPVGAWLMPHMTQRDWSARSACSRPTTAASARSPA